MKNQTTITIASLLTKYKSYDHDFDLQNTFLDNDNDQYSVTQSVSKSDNYKENKKDRDKYTRQNNNHNHNHKRKEISYDNNDDIYILFGYTREPLSDLYESELIYSWVLKDTESIFSKLYKHFIKHPHITSPMKLLVCKYNHSINNNRNCNVKFGLTRKSFRKWEIEHIKSTLPHFKFYLDWYFVCHLSKQNQELPFHLQLNVEEAIPSLTINSLLYRSFKMNSRNEIVERCRILYPNIYKQINMIKSKNRIIRDIIVQEINAL